jgi:hypothetical protein
LATQSDDLGSISQEAQEHAQAMAAVRADLDATCGSISDDRAQVAAAAESRAADAATAASRSESAATSAVAGLSSLSVYSAEQGAALDELAGTCSE